jgi:citrate lyase subunit beta / citryl-CoA lyase
MAIAIARPAGTPPNALLYVPADKPRALARIERAEDPMPDAVIIDLEDAVAPSAKAAARTAAADFLVKRGAGSRDGGTGERVVRMPVILRVNALETGEGADDLQMAARARPAGILIPKVSAPRDIEQAAGLLDMAGAADLPLWAMIETPMALLNLREICGVRPGRLHALVAGANDYTKETGMMPDAERRLLHPFLFQVVNAARAFGMMAFDGVMNRIGDAAALEAECKQAIAMGFDGKTLIHPSQIAAARRTFAPGDEALARASAIRAAFALPENAGKGVIMLDGDMVERLHLEQALALLGRHGG